MTYATRSEFRADMSKYLKQVKKGDLLFLGTREEKEFVVIPCELIDEEDIASLQSKQLADTIATRRGQKRQTLDEVDALFA